MTKYEHPVTPLPIPPDLRDQLYASAEKVGATLSGHILFILRKEMASVAAREAKSKATA